MRASLFALIVFGTLITGCSAVSFSEFAGREPPMLPERFFAGELQGWGMEVGPLGEIGRRVQVDATGRFDEATATLSLDETWRFDDGHVDRLRWQIRKLGQGRYEALEATLVEAGEGEAAGAAFRLSYRRNVPQSDGSTTMLSLDDWFVQIDPDTVMVRAAISKLAAPIGSLTVLYRHKPSGNSAAAVPEPGAVAAD